MANNERAEKIITAFRAKLVNDRLTREGLVSSDNACEVLREVLAGDAPARLETGPYRPSPNDWTGIFVRGDDAVQYAQSIRLLLAGSPWEFLRNNLRDLASLLESSNESADVRTIVPAMEPKCGVAFGEDGGDLDGMSATVCNNDLPCLNHSPSVPAAKEETLYLAFGGDEYWAEHRTYKDAADEVRRRGFGAVYAPMPSAWSREWWKPSRRDRIRELTKAGALIAAEIDRLLRARRSKEQNNAE